MFKKVISFILTFTMILSITSMMVTPAFAEEATNACKLFTDEGEAEYDTINKAINAVPQGGTGRIVLLRDVKDNPSFSGNKSFILDLNGYVLSPYIETNAVIQSSCDLTIKSSNTTRENRFDENWNLLSASASADQVKYTFNGGVITGSKRSGKGNGTGGGIYSYNGSLTVENVNIVHNSVMNTKVAYGGGIYAKGGNVNISNCVIKYNSAKYSGGGLYLGQGTINVSGCEISNNTAEGLGGGLYLYSTANTAGNTKLSVVDSVFSENEAVTFGGAAYVVDGYNSFKNCTFTNNKQTSLNESDVVEEGGSALNFFGNMTIEDCTFTGNNVAAAAGKSYLGAVTCRGALTLKGKVVMKNNTRGNDNNEFDANLYLDEYKAITLDGLAEGSEIGITMRGELNSFAVANNTDYSEYFFSDDELYCVAYNTSDKVLLLGESKNITNPVAQTNADTNNGYITVAGKGLPGYDVKVTANPNSGCDVASVYYVCDGEETKYYLTKTGDTEYSFTMPSKNVTVYADFVRTAKVCKIAETGTEYPTITDALKAVEACEETTIVLLEDVKEYISLDTYKYVTLDLNGHVLSPIGTSRIIENYGYLKVISSVTNTVHKFDENNNFNDELSAEDTAFTVNGGILTGADINDDGGAIMSEGALSVENVSFVNNKALSGGAVRTNQGDNTFSYCNFLYNTAKTSGIGGGAVFASGNSNSFEGCTFMYNNVVGESVEGGMGGGMIISFGEKTGGAILSYGNTLEIKRCEFKFNEAYDAAGAVATGESNRGAEFICENTNFISNRAGKSAGALKISNKETSIINCGIKNNEVFGESPKCGSAMTVFGKVTIQDSTISDNTFKYSCSMPGAVYYDDYDDYWEGYKTSLTISGTTSIYHNYAGTAEGEAKVESNVFIDRNDDREIRLITLEDVGKETKIGVTMKDYNNPFTPENYTDYQNNFTVDKIDSTKMELVATENNELKIDTVTRITQQPSASNNYTVSVDMEGLSYTAPNYQWKKFEPKKVGDINSFYDSWVDDLYISGGSFDVSNNAIVANEGSCEIYTYKGNLILDGNDGFDYATFTADTNRIIAFREEGDFSTVVCTPSERGEGYYDYVYTNVPGGYFDLITDDESCDYTIYDLKFFKAGTTNVEDTDATLSSGTVGDKYLCEIIFEDGSKLTTDTFTAQELSHGFATKSTVSENDTVYLTHEGDFTPCEYEGETTELTIYAPTALTYDGTDKTANFGLATSFLGGELPTISYEYKATATGTYANAASIKKAGFYKASFTVGEGEDAVTASVEYEIAKKKLTVPDTEVYEKTYDGNTLCDFTVGPILEGVIEPDEVDIQTFYANFDSPDVGNNLKVTVVYVLDGADAGNYYVENGEFYTNILKAEYGVSDFELDSKTAKSVTLKSVIVEGFDWSIITDATVEYAVNTTDTAPTDGWQTSREFKNLDNATTYYFFVKVVESTNYSEFVSSALQVTTDEHDLIVVDAVAPTCHTEGRKAYDKCTICNKLFVEGVEVSLDDLVIGATGNHAWSEWANGERTCTSEGCTASETCQHENVSSGKCKTCGEKVGNTNAFVSILVEVVILVVKLLISLL